MRQLSLVFVWLLLPLLSSLLLLLPSVDCNKDQRQAHVASRVRECDQACKWLESGVWPLRKRQLSVPDQCCKSLNDGKDHPNGGTCLPGNPPTAWCYDD